MGLDNAGLIEFARRNYRLNRTIVSSDNAKIFKDLERTLKLSVRKHRFKTGEDCGTWIIPPAWNIKKAWLKGKDGRTIASYEEHPMFVCPYSKPVYVHLSKEELLPHIFFEPRVPNAFGYNWRYAYDANLRLKDWGISLPLNVVKKLGKGPYEILIDADIKDGEMLIGDVVLPGRSKKELIFVANYCHPGQVNDSFSGLMLFMKVMSVLSERAKLKYTYRFLFLPETIGSAAFLSRHHQRVKNTAMGTIFSEMITAGEEWLIKESRTGSTYLDSLAKEAQRTFKNIKSSPFFSGYSNDELIFDSVQSRIPSIAVQKYPFHEYHTSLDTPERINPDDLQRAFDIVMHMVDVWEADQVYAFVHRAPFWMTRYKLFSDDIYEREQFLMKFEIVYKLLDGEKSVLEIAQQLGVGFHQVNEFVQRMHKEGLVKKVA